MLERVSESLLVDQLIDIGCALIGYLVEELIVLHHTRLRTLSLLGLVVGVVVEDRLYPAVEFLYFFLEPDDRKLLLLSLLCQKRYLALVLLAVHLQL